MDGKKCCRVDGLSKLTKVEELREKLVDIFNADVESQRLFYRGKQVSFHCLINSQLHRCYFTISINPVQFHVTVAEYPLWSHLK